MTSDYVSWVLGLHGERLSSRMGGEGRAAGIKGFSLRITLKPRSGEPGDDAGTAPPGRRTAGLRHLQRTNKRKEETLC